MKITISEPNDYPNPDELRGLAQRAKQHGMTIETDLAGARVDHFALDPAEGRLYLTAFSCTCKQFVCSGGAGCQHLALLLVSKDWIPAPAALNAEMEAVR
jgi:hypothetical protein